MNQYTRRLHLFTQLVNKRCIYDYMNGKWKSSLKNAKTRPEADCNLDHQLLIVDLKPRPRKNTKPPSPLRFDCTTMDENYMIKISNRFAALLKHKEEKRQMNSG